MKLAKSLGCLLVAAACSTTATAGSSCHQIGKLIGGWSGFTDAVESAYTATENFGFGFGMWATIVDTSGKVCAVYSVDGGQANGGSSAGNTAWLGSRVISAQKANTANAFSLDEFSIPTGAVSVTVYPGGSLYGLQHSNPVDPKVAYQGSAHKYGTKRDPLVGKRPGGINVFGGGIALYSEGVKIGALGVSGDTSCRDHSMAFNARKKMGLDEILQDETLSLVAEPTALFQQPACGVRDPNDATEFGVVDLTVED